MPLLGLLDDILSVTARWLAHHVPKGQTSLRKGVENIAVSLLFPVSDDTTDHADYAIACHSKLFGNGRAPTSKIWKDAWRSEAMTKTSRSRGLRETTGLCENSLPQPAASWSESKSP